jgi:hypothetical protein
MRIRDHRPRAVGAAASVLLAVALALAVAGAQDPDDARAIMRRVLRESRARDEVASVQIDLVDSRGRVRRRTTTIYSKKRPDDQSARLIRFHSPPELARSAILTIERADRAADQWLYLPAYHAARRVAPANRGDTWMGTDLTYEDIADPKLEQYDYTILRHEQLDGVRCAVISAIPTDRDLQAQSAYSRTLFWVDRAESVALKIEYYDRAGRLLKILTNAELRRYGPYRRWAATRVHDVTRDHRTVLSVTDRRIDRGLSDEYFGVSHLERGR